MEQVTISRVIEFPIKDSLRILVSFDYLYGIWSEFLTNALMVLPRQLKERLIFLAYSSPSPSTLLLNTFSLPAKSTKLYLALMVLPSPSIFSRYSVKTIWERDDAWLRWVYLIFFRWFPLFISSKVSSLVFTYWIVRFWMWQLLLISLIFKSCSCSVENKSIKVYL